MSYFLPAGALLVLGALFACWTSSGAAGRDIVTFDQGVRINVAGRQRMLSQRMAKAACFATLGVTPEAHDREMRAAHGLFAISLADLTSGSAERRISAATDPSEISQLQAVQKLWGSYGGTVLAFDGDTRSQDQITQLKALSTQSIAILNEMETAVNVMESLSKSERYNPRLASAINVSGRQRMLSQRMLKETCLIAAGVDERLNRAFLVGTVALFESAQSQLTSELNTLQLGAAQISALEEQFKVVQEKWSNIKGFLTSTLDGGTPTTADFGALAQADDAFLASLNTVVTLYVGE